MNSRLRWMIVIAAALLLTTVILLPRIIEAKRLKGLNATKSLAVTPTLSPNQDQGATLQSLPHITTTPLYLCAI